MNTYTITTIHSERITVKAHTWDTDIDGFCIFHNGTCDCCDALDDVYSISRNYVLSVRKEG